MKVLAIETSCDETAIAILESGEQGTAFTVLGETLFSQAKLHREYGGVYPNLAKREHQKNLIPLTHEALSKAQLLHGGKSSVAAAILKNIREDDFKNNVIQFLEQYKKPDIDLIAVTHGPGLEPALWTGVVFAQMLGSAWNIPVIGINHMEGHIVSGLVQKTNNAYVLASFSFPLLALLISGGHTELVLMRDWFQYKLVGRTKDDAVGEAYDKVARMLDLPYPGGPEIDTNARRAREKNTIDTIKLPRPMIHDNTCDFSFSGLKTAVLYKIKEMGELTTTQQEEVSRAFEEAVCDVLVEKTKRALELTGAETFVMGGGVSANKYLRENITNMIHEHYSGVLVNYPDSSLTGDNAIMIGIAALLRVHHKILPAEDTIVATGSLSLTN